MSLSFINLLYLFIGVIIGCFIDPLRIETSKRHLTHFKNKLLHKDLGAVRRPDAQHLRERGTLVAETKDAMKETLDKDPYLNENYSE